MHGIATTSNPPKRSLSLRLTAALVSLTSLLAASGVAIGGVGGPTDGLGEQLSDEQTITRWAFADSRDAILAEPSSSAQRIGRLTYATPEQQREVYLVQRRYKPPGGGPAWLKIRVPKPPNETTGWVKEKALGALHTIRTQLVIDKANLRAELYKNGNQIFSAPIGIGTASTPTPEGNFYVREGLAIPGGSAYGAYAFGTSAFSSIDDWPGNGPPTVGLHGTNQPELIPGQISHGCVRFTDAKITELRKLMPLGTPVLIR